MRVTMLCAPRYALRTIWLNMILSVDHTSWCVPPYGLTHAARHSDLRDTLAFTRTHVVVCLRFGHRRPIITSMMSSSGLPELYVCHSDTRFSNLFAPPAQHAHIVVWATLPFALWIWRRVDFHTCSHVPKTCKRRAAARPAILLTLHSGDIAPSDTPATRRHNPAHSRASSRGDAASR